MDRLARHLATGPAHAYAQTKALLTCEQDMSLSAAVELEPWTAGRNWRDAPAWPA